MMSRHADEVIPANGRRLRTIGIGGFGWVGLACAVAGWTLLLAESAVNGIVSIKTALPVTATHHDDVLGVAKCLIGSGFGLAIVGAIRTGFGALNQFFDAVLTRSNRRSMGPYHRDEPVVATDERRPYRAFPDGSVEVDTILGTRRFATMSQARDFI